MAEEEEEEEEKEGRAAALPKASGRTGGRVEDRIGLGVEKHDIIIPCSFP